MSWDKIVTSAPVNAQAARQMGRGTEWAPKIKIQDWYQNCPPLADMNDQVAQVRLNPEFIDFTGRKFSRLTVIGLMKKDSSHSSSWVCRCVCGGYCTRKSKSLKVMDRGGNSAIYECGRCNYLHKLQRGWMPVEKSKDAPG